MKKFVFGSVLSFLFLPLLQEQIHFIHLKPLNGVIEKIENPEFSFRGWLERDFQEKKEKYLNQEFGLRNLYVKLHNQFCYSVYGEAYAKWVVVGRENYLYESGYIDAYYGRDFIGEAKIKDQTEKLRFVQDTLRRLNKNLMVVIAPGKASFFPEYIPEGWRSEKARTNYEAFRDNFQDQDVDYLDFSRWFNGMKGKSEHPLFPQYGVHWSTYGASIALDSLLKKVEELRKIDLPDLVVEGYETPDTIRSPDEDVYRGMNLLLEPVSYRMTYPVLRITDDSTKTKPSILVIADSYFWNINNLWVMNRIFSNYRFCFYYQEVYSDSIPTGTKFSQLNLRNEINKSDVILILSRNADIHRLGWGFIDECHALFSAKEKE